MNKETELQKAFEGIGFENLSKPLKKDLSYLSKEVRLKELQELTPLIDELIELKKRSENLELTKEENGSIAKDSIEDFKSLKSDLRSFNAKIRKDIDKSKKPYMLINKAFIAVKKGFEEEQSSMLSTAETLFKEYLDQEAEKKAERERKKQEALRKEQLESEAESKARLDEANKITAYNNLKYEVLEDYKKSYIEICKTYSIDALKNELKQRNSHKSLMGFFEYKSSDFGFSSLEENKQLEIIEKYNLINNEINEIIHKSIADKIENIHKAIEEQSIELKPVGINSNIEINNSKEIYEKALLEKIVHFSSEFFLTVDKHINNQKEYSKVFDDAKEHLRILKNLKLENGSNN